VCACHAEWRGPKGLKGVGMVCVCVCVCVKEAGTDRDGRDDVGEGQQHRQVPRELDDAALDVCVCVWGEVSSGMFHGRMRGWTDACGCPDSPCPSSRQT
jgi:hypothetical protein